MNSCSKGSVRPLQVLKVTKETPANEVRSNYMRLSRLVHPDKCTHPDAGKASAVLNQVQPGQTWAGQGPF